MYWSAEEISKTCSEESAMIQEKLNAYLEIKFGLICYTSAIFRDKNVLKLANKKLV